MLHIKERGLSIVWILVIVAIVIGGGFIFFSSQQPEEQELVVVEKSQENIIEILQKIAEDGKQENKELRKQIGELQKSSNVNHGQAMRVAWTFGIGALILAFGLTALT